MTIWIIIVDPTLQKNSRHMVKRFHRIATLRTSTDACTEPGQEVTVITLRIKNEIENLGLVKLLRFFRKIDELDIAVYDAIEPLLSLSLVDDENTVTTGNIEDIIMRFIKIDTIVVTGHLNHILFPFLMLRYCNAIQNAEPVPVDYLISFQLISEQTNDASLL